MYNEDQNELINTLNGLVENYIELREDKELQFEKDDFLVFIICDGYDKIPAEFREYAKDKGFFDQEIIQNYMKVDRETKQFKMKDMKEIMDDGVEEIP